LRACRLQLTPLVVRGTELRLHPTRVMHCATASYYCSLSENAADGGWDSDG
jgi:hypothetical protein